MDMKLFDSYVREALENSAGVLRSKNQRYSADENPIHNFEVGAQLIGGTPAQAAWGYLTKHLVALRDRVMRNDFADKEDLQEKVCDSINYLLFIYAIGCQEHETGKYMSPEDLLIPTAK